MKAKNRIFMRFIFLLIIISYLPPLFSQVVINEVHVRPSGGENGHLDHPKTEYVDQLFSFV